MKLLRPTATLLLTLFAYSTDAQLLTNGNSNFPSCATSCTALNQAAQACGGTTSADQTIWSCFCQSAYLSSLYNSDDTLCSAFCTSSSDQAQIVTWYKSNCGSDDGASEHADSGTTTVVQTSTSYTSTISSTATAAVAVATTSNAALPSTTATGGTYDPADSQTTQSGSWWSTHYKWIAMLIAIFVGLALVALIAVLLKRRHDRKQDQIREGFNTGITTRSTPMSTVGSRAPADASYLSNTQAMAAGGLESGGGRNSPARTREAFMPYGYGYARSESRLARGATPVGDLEKEVGMGAGQPETPQGASAKKKKRVLVRERGVDGPESPDVEKRM